jgi:uncharacterized membrane protein YbhN (UPF0104 family)
MTNKNTKPILQFIVLFGIGILLVWLSLKQVASQKDNIINAFKHANYLWVLLSLMVVAFSHFLRAYRWNYLLRPLGYKTNLLNATCQVLVVFLIIFILSLLIQFNELIGLANEFVFDKLREKLLRISNNPSQLIGITIIVMVMVLVFIAIRKKVTSLLKGKLGGIIKGMGEGIGSIRKMDRPLQFIVLSLLIWACYFYSLYICFFALSGTSHLGHKECLTILLFGTFGVIFSPGGLGAYPLIVYGILFKTYHVDEVSSFALPWLGWTSQFVLLLVLGVLSLIALPIINREKNVVSRTA